MHRLIWVHTGRTEVIKEQTLKIFRIPQLFPFIQAYILVKECVQSLGKICQGLRHELATRSFVRQMNGQCDSNILP